MIAGRYSTAALRLIQSAATEHKAARAVAIGVVHQVAAAGDLPDLAMLETVGLDSQGGIASLKAAR